MRLGSPSPANTLVADPGPFNLHGNHGPAGVLFDDVVVSRSPIGAGGAGTPAESPGWGTLKSLFR